MSKMECKCGKCLSNSECPNDIEWYIYSEFKNWINKDYFEYTEEQENFDYFWLCPNCKRAYVWLNRNKKYEETRTYEYRKINNINIDISKMEEIFIFSSNDEEKFGDYIIIKDLMNLYPHNHRYFITKDEKIVYLHDIRTNRVDGKYIITYSSTNQYDIKLTNNNEIEIIKIHDGIERYFDEDGNEKLLEKF